MRHSPWNSGAETQLARAICCPSDSLCSPVYPRESYFGLTDNRGERLNCCRDCKKIHGFYSLGCLFLFSPGYRWKKVVSVEWWPFSSLYEVNLVVSDECIEMDVHHKDHGCYFSEVTPEGTWNSSNLFEYEQGCLQVWGLGGSTICLCCLRVFALCTNGYLNIQLWAVILPFCFHKH